MVQGRIQGEAVQRSNGRAFQFVGTFEGNGHVEWVATVRCLYDGTTCRLSGMMRGVGRAGEAELSALVAAHVQSAVERGELGPSTKAHRTSRS